MLSCELVLDVNLPAQKAKLVVNSIISTDCVMVASITQSKDVLDTNYIYNEVQNVTMKVFDESGAVVDFAKRLTMYGETIYRSDKSPLPGQTYTIQVEAPGFDAVEGKTRFPDLVENLTVEIDSSQILDFRIPIDVKFRDKPDQKNYYEVYLTFNTLVDYWSIDYVTKDTLARITYTNWSRSALHFKKTDVHTGESLFSDTYCNGGQCNLKSSFSSQDYYGSNFEILDLQIEVLNISPDYFDYLSTSDLQGKTKSDPFSQPVQVFNNIKNGYGIFAGYSKTIYKIK
jgi:hypothetical protein